LDGNTGGYSLSLNESDGTVGAACSPASSDASFVQLALNQPVDCALTSDGPVSLEDPDGGIHYAEVFGFSAPGGTLTISVDSQAFTPLILVFDPQTGQILAQEVGTLTADFGSCDVLFLVRSTEVQATGPFTVAVGDNAGSAGPGGFNSFSNQPVPQFTIRNREAQ
jgi:hypothetical protein